MTAGCGGAPCLSEGGRITDFLCSLLSFLPAGGVAGVLRHAVPSPTSALQQAGGSAASAHPRIQTGLT